MDLREPDLKLPKNCSNNSQVYKIMMSTYHFLIVYLDNFLMLFEFYILNTFILSHNVLNFYQQLYYTKQGREAASK